MAALVALAASGALLADYSGLAPAFCTAGSGCAKVRQMGFGSVPVLPGLYVPVPLLGIIAFALLLGLTLLPNPIQRRRLTSLAALAAGVVGLGLLVVQAFVVGAFCSLCVTVDLAGVVAAVGGFFYLRDRRPPAELVTPFGWAALAVVSSLAPFYWPKVRPAPAVPAEIAKLYQPGKINVVEFADFQCPYCRRLHPTLKKLNREYGAKVNFIRLNLPLPGHPDARPAAIAAVCADEQGKGEAMSDLLFEAESLGEGSETTAARTLGLDLERFRRCLTSKEASARVDREAKILRDAGFDGLPTTFVGSDKIIGAQPEETFRAAYERAERGVGQSGTPWPVYLLVALASMAAIAWFGRVRPAASEHD
jgi:predicted DsbA family dithiol-disulfide isomerase/uncharacterized membrane protein